MRETEGPHNNRTSNKNYEQYFLLDQNGKRLKSTKLNVGKGGEKWALSYIDESIKQQNCSGSQEKGLQNLIFSLMFTRSR